MALNRAAGCALLVLVAATLLGPRTAAAQSTVNITYQGKTYELTTAVGNTSFLNAQLTSVFWWPNATAAVDACNLVNRSFGLPNEEGTTGPWFLYSIGQSTINGWVTDETSSDCWAWTGSVSNQYTFAVNSQGPAPSPSPDASPSASPSASPDASPSASPEASPSASLEASPEASPSASPGASPDASPEASPSASPEASPSPSPVSLDCNLAAFSPPILASRVTSQICAANKAVRRGKQSKLVTNVTLSLLDASNQPATINITDIITNKLTAGWQCKCRPTARDNCTCLPNAVLLGGGNFLVMPQWRRSTRPGNIIDTTLQVSFTATADNGGTCNGTAVICSAWRVRRNQPPPACAPFNSTGVARPALTCI